MKMYICDVCDENTCFVGGILKSITNLPLGSLCKDANFQETDRYKIKLSTRASQLSNKDKKDKSLDDLEKDLMKAKIRAINASSEAKELKNQRARGESSIWRFKPAVDKKDFAKVIKSGVKFSACEEGKEESISININGTPNCSLCMWQEQKHIEQAAGKISVASRCIAQGDKLTTHCYRSDECKLLYKVKEENGQTKMPSYYDPNKDKWIEEMEYTARTQIVSPYDTGDLLCVSPVVVYNAPYNSGEISLEGEFTIQQLQALINHMQKYNKEEE